MTGILYIIGVIILILSLIGAFSAGGFLNFLIVLFGGITSAVILFAIAKILENQEEIKYKVDLYAQNNSKRSFAKKKCQRCEKEYDQDLRSCPFCGNRE